MSRGDDGLLLEVGQRVSYVQETNARGPIAHYAKPIEDDAAAPAPADFPALAKPGPWGTATSPKAAPKPPPAPPVKKPKLRGTVTAVRPREAPSYGFVRPDAGGDDVFVAFVDVESAGQLAEGDRVDYELVPNAGARKSNRTSGDPKYAVKCGHVVVLPKGAPKLGAPKASAGPAHLRRAPPPPSVGQGFARQGHGARLLAPAQQERAQLQAAMQASAREYEADQLRQAQRLSIGDRRRQGCAARADHQRRRRGPAGGGARVAAREARPRARESAPVAQPRDGPAPGAPRGFEGPRRRFTVSTGCGQYRPVRRAGHCVESGLRHAAHGGPVGGRGAARARAALAAFDGTASTRRVRHLFGGEQAEGAAPAAPSAATAASMSGARAKMRSDFEENHLWARGATSPMAPARRPPQFQFANQLGILGVGDGPLGHLLRSLQMVQLAHAR